MSDDHWPHEEDGQAPEEKITKKDTFWTLRPRPVSDEEFVEQVRKSSVVIRRWRWVAVVFVALLLVMIWEMRRMVQIPGQVAPGAWPSVSKNS